MEKSKSSSLYGEEKALPAYEIVKREILDSFYNCSMLLKDMKFHDLSKEGKFMFYDFCAEISHFFTILRDDAMEEIKNEGNIEANREDREKFAYLLNLDKDMESPNFLLKSSFKVTSEDYLKFLSYFRLLSRLIHYLNIKNIKIKTIAPDKAVLEGFGISVS